MFASGKSGLYAEPTCGYTPPSDVGINKARLRRGAAEKVSSLELSLHASLNYAQHFFGTQCACTKREAIHAQTTGLPSDGAAGEATGDGTGSGGERQTAPLRLTTELEPSPPV